MNIGGTHRHAGWPNIKPLVGGLMPPELQNPVPVFSATLLDYRNNVLRKNIADLVRLIALCVCNFREKKHTAATADQHSMLPLEQPV